MRDHAIDLLQRLTAAHGAPGAEHAVRRIFAAELGPNLQCDRSGSVLCEHVGAAAGPRVLVTGHMDEVGFAVQSITPDGYLRLVAIGSWWEHTLLSQRVRVLTRSGAEVLGVIAATPIHLLEESQRDKVIKLDKLFVDVGASSAADARERLGIALGDPLVPDSPMVPFNHPNLFMAKAFDNRVGIGATIQALQALRTLPHPNTVVGVGTVQEEVGTRGAQTAMAVARADVALVLEGAPADDLPGAGRAELQGAVGLGPQVRLLDPTAIMNRELVQLVLDTAAATQIPVQVAVRRSGGTDARAIHLHGAGIPSIVLGVPARYIHSHNSIINIEDYLGLVRLVIAVVQRLDAATVARLTAFV